MASEKVNEKTTTYPKIDTTEIKRYMRLLDPDADEIMVQYYEEPKGSNGYQGHRPHYISRLNSLHDQQEHRCGIAAMVNVSPEGRKYSDDMTIRAVYCEADDGLPEGGFSAFPLEPSMIVESSPGKYHMYWIVDREQGELSVADFRQIIHTMIAEYGSDPGAKDPTRVLRLPGTWHQKDPDNPHLVRIIEASEERYSPKELKAAFPPVEGYQVKPQKAKRQTDQSAYDNTLAAVAPPWGETLNALASISADERDDWVKVGMALRSTYGDTDKARAVFHGWSATSIKYERKDADNKWQSFSDPGERGDGVEIGTLFHLAKEHHNPSEEGQLIRRRRAARMKANIDPEIWASLGASEEADHRATAKEVNKLKEQAGVDLSKTVSDGQIALPETTSNGKTPKGNSRANIVAALNHLGIKLSFSTFALEIYAEGVGGKPGRVRVDDLMINDLWFMVQKLGLQPEFQFFKRAMLDIARENPFHQVKDYFNRLDPWDRKERRAGNWLSKYANADGDNEHIRELGELILAAAYYRVHKPGIKFDLVPVLLSKQGMGKSTLIRYLASDDLFTDCARLGDDPKKFIEQTNGVWIVEIAELEGMGKREVSTIRSMVTRTRDDARKVWGTSTSKVPRQMIMIATTNPDQFLKDQAGNRRFPVVEVGKIDLDGVAADRDQIWAEVKEVIAPKYEDKPLVLSEEAQNYFEQESENYLQRTPTREALETHLPDYGKIEIDTVWAILGSDNASRAQRKPNDRYEIGRTMAALGYREYQKLKRPDGKRRVGFKRENPEGETPWLEWDGTELKPALTVVDGDGHPNEVLTFPVPGDDEVFNISVPGPFNGEKGTADERRRRTLEGISQDDEPRIRRRSARGAEGEEWTFGEALAMPGRGRIKKIE